MHEQRGRAAGRGERERIPEPVAARGHAGRAGRAGPRPSATPPGRARRGRPPRAARARRSPRAAPARRRGRACTRAPRPRRRPAPSPSADDRQRPAAWPPRRRRGRRRSRPPVPRTRWPGAARVARGMATQPKPTTSATATATTATAERRRPPRNDSAASHNAPSAVSPPSEGDEPAAAAAREMRGGEAEGDAAAGERGGRHLAAPARVRHRQPRGEHRAHAHEAGEVVVVHVGAEGRGHVRAWPGRRSATGSIDHCTAPKTACAPQVASTTRTSRRAAAASRPRSLQKTITPPMAARSAAASSVKTRATLRPRTAWTRASAGSANAGAASHGRRWPRAREAEGPDRDREEEDRGHRVPRDVDGGSVRPRRGDDRGQDQALGHRGAREPRIAGSRASVTRSGSTLSPPIRPSRAPCTRAASAPPRRAAVARGRAGRRLAPGGAIQSTSGIARRASGERRARWDCDVTSAIRRQPRSRMMGAAKSDVLPRARGLGLEDDRVGGDARGDRLLRIASALSPPTPWPVSRSAFTRPSGTRAPRACTRR